MRVSNIKLFNTKNETMDLIRSGEYYGILQTFQPLLRAWWQKFESLNCTLPFLFIGWTILISTIVPKYPRIVLSIEFEYARQFIFSYSPPCC